jgi:hypothetical protein
MSQEVSKEPTHCETAKTREEPGGLFVESAHGALDVVSVHKENFIEK